MLKNTIDFVTGSARLALRGNRWYFAWIGLLGVLILWGATAWWQQVTNGLIVTKLRVPSFIATLGMLLILSGAVDYWTGGAPRGYLSDGFRRFGIKGFENGEERNHAQQLVIVVNDGNDILFVFNPHQGIDELPLQPARNVRFNGPGFHQGLLQARGKFHAFQLLNGQFDEFFSKFLECLRLFFYLCFALL